MLYKKTSKELVYDLIAEANPNIQPPLDANNSFIEQISTINPGPANGNKNTRARIRGYQGEGFSGSFLVYYNRLNLGLIVLGNDALNNRATYLGVTNYTATVTHSLLPQISLLSGVELRTWDLGNQGIAGAGNADYTTVVTLVAAPTSPAYTGNLPIYVSRGRPVLSDQLHTFSLDELTHVDPLTDRKSAGLLTWGKDFSQYRNYLGVTSAGMPQWVGLRKVLDEMGIPTYPAPVNGNFVTDNTTSSVARANRNYDRVVVHTGINAEGIVGVAYYHYNNT